MIVKDGTKRDLENLANFEEPVFDQDMIRDWAQSDDGAGLPYPSALAFSTWLDTGWPEYDDPERDQTNADILWSALDEWTGGRAVRPTAELKASYAAACDAHAALYEGVDDPDAPEDNGWRRGPHPIRLADFFAALSGTGTLIFLKD